MQDQGGMELVKKILVVDDETFFLQMMDGALRSPSTSVKAVETGRAALQEINATLYNLCFLDIGLPDLDGTEVLKKIAEVSPRTKVVMMTAGDVNGNAKQIIEKYAFMFLTKPIELLQLRLLTKNIPEGSAH
jgi:DNA-binding NtrC family response regulator